MVIKIILVHRAPMVVVVLPYHVQTSITAVEQTIAGLVVVPAQKEIILVLVSIYIIVILQELAAQKHRVIIAAIVILVVKAVLVRTCKKQVHVRIQIKVIH